MEKTYYADKKAASRVDLIRKIEAAQQNDLRTMLDVMHPAFLPIRQLLEMREKTIKGYFANGLVYDALRNNYLNLFEHCNDQIKQFLGL